MVIATQTELQGHLQNTLITIISTTTTKEGLRFTNVKFSYKYVHKVKTIYNNFPSVNVY